MFIGIDLGTSAVKVLLVDERQRVVDQASAPLSLSPTAIFTLGFFCFWMLAAASSALTCFLQRPAGDINSFCPVEPSARPAGCCPREPASRCD